tara:strand:+ start:22471 stop:22836 length:366 start_codon:yes stop_codon:yes gene_type:complete
MSAKTSVKANNVSTFKNNNNLIITKKKEKKEKKLNINEKSELYKGPVGTFFTKNKKKKSKLKLHYPKDYFDEYSRIYLGRYSDSNNYEQEYQQDESDYESDYNESEEEIESTENIGRRYWD